MKAFLFVLAFKVLRHLLDDVTNGPGRLRRALHFADALKAVATGPPRICLRCLRRRRRRRSIDAFSQTLEMKSASGISPSGCCWSAIRDIWAGPTAVATRDAVRALSFAEVDAIVERFSALNPYNREAVPDSILKVEDVNFQEGASRQLWCYAISSKRYALFTLDEKGVPHVAIDPKGEAACSEHGLGHLLNPTDVESDDRKWIVQTWETIAREHLNLPNKELPWLDRPALTRLTVSTPYLWAPFEETQTGVPYPERVKPFNFLLAAHIAPLGFPPGADKARFLLIAPFESDPKRWLRLPWRDVHTRKDYRITTDAEQRLYQPERVLVQTYRDALALFRLHPEAKSLRADGLPCDELHRNYAGLLLRRPARVPPGAIEHIGKEMNELDDVLAGIVHDEDSIVTRYANRSVVPFDRIRVLLRAIPMRELRSRTGCRLAERTIERARQKTGVPHPENQQLLREAIIGYALDGGELRFAAIERLDPAGMAAEVRARAKLSARRQSPSRAALEEAREELAAEYETRIRAALGLLGL